MTAKFQGRKTIVEIIDPDAGLRLVERLERVLAAL